MRRVLLSSLLLCAVLGGCGHTQIRESHVFQTRDAGGQVSYYRVRISGDAILAKTHYRAGLYDSEALDSLMGSPTSEHSKRLVEELQKKKLAAIRELSDIYYSKLKNGTDEEVRNAEARLSRAMREPVEHAGQDDAEAPAVRRKYAIIFSSLASVVEEAIANFAEERETTETVLMALGSQRREEYIAAMAKLEALARIQAQLQEIKLQLGELKPKFDQDTTSPSAIEQLESLLAAIAALEVE